MISALSPGLARKAAQICRYSTITTSAHSDQKHHHPDEKDPGRRKLEWVDVLRHGDGISAPNSPDNKARTRRKEEPRLPPPGTPPPVHPLARLVPPQAPRRRHPRLRAAPPLGRMLSDLPGNPLYGLQVRGDHHQRGEAVDVTLTARSHAGAGEAIDVVLRASFSVRSSSRWMSSLPARMPPVLIMSSRPSRSVTKPPASRTNAMPPAISHGERPRSQ